MQCLQPRLSPAHHCLQSLSGWSQMFAVTLCQFDAMELEGTGASGRPPQPPQTCPSGLRQRQTLVCQGSTNTAKRGCATLLNLPKVMLPDYETVHDNLMLSALGLWLRNCVLPNHHKTPHYRGAGPQSSQWPVGGYGAGQT